METTIMGLGFRDYIGDNGKENGNYYHSIMGYKG